LFDQHSITDQVQNYFPWQCGFTKTFGNVSEFFGSAHLYIRKKNIYLFFLYLVLADRIAWTGCASVNKTVSLQSSRSTESSAGLFLAIRGQTVGAKILWMCPTRADFGALPILDQ
jgi:hypothetical protein